MNKKKKSKARADNSSKDFSLNLDLSRISMNYSGSSCKKKQVKPTPIPMRDLLQFEALQNMQKPLRDHSISISYDKENCQPLPENCKRPPLVRHNSIHDGSCINCANCSQTKRERSNPKEYSNLSVGSLLATTDTHTKYKDRSHSPGYYGNPPRETYSTPQYPVNTTANPLSRGYLQQPQEKEVLNLTGTLSRPAQYDEKCSFLLQNADPNRTNVSDIAIGYATRHDNQSFTINAVPKYNRSDSGSSSRRIYHHSPQPSVGGERNSHVPHQQQMEYSKQNSRRSSIKYQSGIENQSNRPPRLNLNIKNESFEDQYSSGKLYGEIDTSLTQGRKYVQNTERIISQIINSSQHLLEALPTDKQKERLTTLSIMDNKLHQISTNESITERGAQRSPSKKESSKSRSRRDSASFSNEVLNDLKATIKEKENELQELKNKRQKNDDETQRLFQQIKNLSSANKKSEEQIAKMKEELLRKDIEISQLKSSRDKLETTVQELKAQIKKEEKERENEMLKNRRLEQILDEKSNEMTEILNKMEAFEKNGERTLQNERVEHLLEKNALAEKLTENELLVQKLQVEIDKNEKAKKEYAMIDSKIEELEAMQQSLIAENEALKKKLMTATQSNNSTTILRICKDPKETKENSVNTFSIRKFANRIAIFLPKLNLGCNPEIISLIIGAAHRIGETADLAKRVIQVIQSMAKGIEPDIQLILKHNIAGKGSMQKETEFTMKGLKQRAQENSEGVNELHKLLVSIVDAVCDLYAIKFGAVCGL